MNSKPLLWRNARIDGDPKGVNYRNPEAFHLADRLEIAPYVYTDSEVVAEAYKAVDVEVKPLPESEQAEADSHPDPEEDEYKQFAEKARELGIAGRLPKSVDDLKAEIDAKSKELEGAHQE